VVSVDRALAQVRAELATFPDPVPPADAARWAGLRRREALLVARRASIAATVGEELLRPLSPAELAPPTASPPGPTPASAPTPTGAR
jgi:poly-gamma-glutamate synthesis protein (capsule biosynthesis protein)